jgi:hypothetical protein
VHAPAFGFGAGGAHLPQPDWFASYAVDAEEEDPASTLSLYRRALAARHALLAEERLDWLETGRDDVLHYVRPNGWEVVTNFGTEPYTLEAAGRAVVLATGDAASGGEASGGEASGPAASGPDASESAASGPDASESAASESAASAVRVPGESTVWLAPA